MFKLVNGILPAFINYTDSEKVLGGNARGPLVTINSRHQEDEGLLAHELRHVTQFYRLGLPSFISLFILFKLFAPVLIGISFLGLAAHSILYMVFDKYRLWSEVDAYKVQLKYYTDDRRILFANFIADDYKLKIPVEKVYKML